MDHLRIALSAVMVCSYLSDHASANGPTKEGHCPASSCCTGNSRVTDECVIDTDCPASEKCCFSGCESTCRAPLPQPGRCLNMEYGSFIKFQVSEADKLKNLSLGKIKIGFITKQKQGILLQISNGHLNSFQYVSLEINNWGGVKLFIDSGFERWETNTGLAPWGVFADGEAHELIVTSMLPGIDIQNDKEVIQRQYYTNLLDTIAPNDINSIFIGNNETNASDKGFSGCIYSIEIDDINLFDEVVQEPRPANIQMIPNESTIFKDMACGSNK